MKLKKMMIVSFVLLAILTIGAVSASSDMDSLSQDPTDANSVLENSTVVVTEENECIFYSEGHIDLDDADADEQAVIVAQFSCNTGGNVTISDINDYEIFRKDLGQIDEDDEYRITYGEIKNIDYLTTPDNVLFLRFYNSEGVQSGFDTYCVQIDEFGFGFDPVIIDNEVSFRLPPGPINPSEDEDVMALVAQSYDTAGVITVVMEVGKEEWEYIVEDLVIDYYNYEYYMEDHSYDGDGIWYFIPSSLFDFHELEDGDILRFYFLNDTYSMSEDFRLIIDNPETRVYFESLEPDFEVEFFSANVADHDVVIVVPKGQDVLADVSEFTVEIDFWGDQIVTQWDVNEVPQNDDEYYWTTTDLGIDERMWDISGYVDCEVVITAIDVVNEENYRCSGGVTFTNTPLICSGELSPFVESESAIYFTYFPECDDEFIISIKKDGVFFANRTFKISEMDPYREDDGYSLFLEDLGISELGEYEVSVIFNGVGPNETQKVYTNTFNVVEFVIISYTRDDLEEIGQPVFRIALPEDTEGNAIIKVNGTQVFNETLSEIGYIDYYRGSGYYIRLNSLNIMESGYYNVELTVNALNVSRHVDADLYVNVTENTFEFYDNIYGGGIINAHLGTPISPDSEIVLYLDGKKAAVGVVDEEFGFDYEESYADIYGNLLPGQYQARLEIDGESVAEDAVEVKDTSGNVEANITQVNGEYYLNFKAPWPEHSDVDGYYLNVYLDAEHPGDMGYENEPIISYGGEELQELLDNEMHALYIGKLESGSHVIYVEYRTEMEDTPLEDQDFFVRIFDVVVGKVNTNIAAVYDADAMEIVATLTNGETGQAIKGANLRFVVDGASHTVKSDANGQAKLSIADLAPDTYTATVSYNGNSKYNPSNASVDFVVKADTNISAVYDADAMEIVATLTNGATGQVIRSANVRFVIDGQRYTVKTNSNGQAKFSTASLAGGTYNATVSYDGNSRYNPSSASVEFTAKADTNLTLDYDNGAREVVATLTNAVTGQAIKNANVRFVVNGEKYTVKSDANGQAKVSVSTLAMDTYQATASYNGNSKYNPTDTAIEFTITKIITSVSMYYDSQTNELVATLVNAETGKAISGATLVFNVNGVKTSAKTDKQGQARFTPAGVDLDNFNAGISYGGNSKYLKSTGSIKIIAGKIPTIISNTYDKQAQEVTATLTNNQTGQFIKGATVVFNVNGVKTSFKTDALGQVKISVAELDLGTNSIGSSYGGNSKYAGSTTGINIIKI